MTMNSEYSSVSKACTVADNAGAFVLKDGWAQLAWVDEKDNMSYMLNANALEEQILISVAEALMKKISK